LLKRTNLVELARALGGLPVYGCLPHSPAERAGVRYGDVLLSVDGQATASWDAYLRVREHSGDSIRLRLFRDGVEFELDVLLDRSAGFDPAALSAALGFLQGEPGASH
jgi:S1-C subfamily serine protease